jgi:integrase
MSVATRPRHPVTGRRFWLRARTPRELDAYIHRIESLRTELRLRLRSPEDVERELRHLRFGPVTLERAALSYLERPLAANTRRTTRGLVEGNLAPLLPLPLASLDVPCVSRWIEGLRRAGLEDTTVDFAWRRLSSIITHACERGWIAARPWGPWRPRLARRSGKDPREATRDVLELVRILAAARVLDERAGERLPAIEAKSACAGLLGARQGELGGLRWDDVDPSTPSVLLARQYDGAKMKTKRARRIETIPELLEVLARHRARLEAACLYSPRGPIFPHIPSSSPGHARAYARGEVLTRRDLRSAVALAGLPNLRAWSAHSLRDSFVSLEASATGGDLRRVSLRSGHESLASLARYLRTMSREHPAPPAIGQLPSIAAGGTGTPTLAAVNPSQEKETPP